MSITATAGLAATALVGFAAGATQDTSITIDPTFWVAFFAFLGVAVNAIVAIKTRQKTIEIAEKVDGAATASLAEMEKLRTEIARLNEDRLARADAAPAPAGPEALAAVPDKAPDPVPVVVVDAEKPIEVHVVKPGTPYKGEK